MLAKRLCSKRKRFAVAGTFALVCGLADGLRAEAVILVAQITEKDGVHLVLGSHANENICVAREKCDGGVKCGVVRSGCCALCEVVEIAQCGFCGVWALGVKQSYCGR